jgi:Predicted thioesterase
MDTTVRDLINEAVGHTRLQPIIGPAAPYRPEDAAPAAEPPVAVPRPAPPRETGLPLPDRPRHVYHRQVRFGDIDPHGHVNNVRFLEYLEDARIALLLEFLGTDADDGSMDLLPGIAVARHEVNYRRPLRFRAGSVRVESWTTKVGLARCELAAVIRDDNDVFAEARSVLVAYDPLTRRPRRFTPDERAFLRRYQA